MSNLRGATSRAARKNSVRISDEDTYRLLTRHGTALCIADGSRFPRVDILTADFPYLRFHGRTFREAPFYGDEQLLQEARFVQPLLSQGIDCYAYFNNDALAHAPMNAARLRELFGEQRCASTLRGSSVR